MLQTTLYKLFGDEERRKILNYLGRRISHKKLGISNSYLYLLKTGKRRITDEIFGKMLRELSAYELLSLSWWAGWDLNPRPPPCKGLKDRELVNKLADGLSKLMNSEFVNRELEVYERYLKAKNLSNKTVKTHLTYLSRFLYSGLPLNVEGVLSFLEGLSGYAKVHAVKSLRLYFKLRGRRDLLDVIKTPIVRFQPQTYCPTLEEVVKIAGSIDWLPAKTYFILLAESGLRPGELFNIGITRIDLDTRISEIRNMGIDVENRVIIPLRESTSKRAFCSFYTSIELVEKYIEEYNVKDAMFPQSKRKIRVKIYEGMEKALGRSFELYALRRFWTTEMYRRGLNPLTIDLLQGRKPKIYRVMLDHYLKLTIRDLQKEYDQANMKIHI